MLTRTEYYVHDNPIAQNGSCSPAGGVLDPYNVTTAVDCNPNDPQYCMVGDLSGKHGLINGTGFSTT